MVNIARHGRNAHFNTLPPKRSDLEEYDNKPMLVKPERFTLLSDCETYIKTRRSDGRPKALKGWHCPPDCLAPTDE